MLRYPAHTPHYLFQRTRHMQMPCLGIELVGKAYELFLNTLRDKIFYRQFPTFGDYLILGKSGTGMAFTHSCMTFVPQ